MLLFVPPRPLWGFNFLQKLKKGAAKKHDLILF